jgi:4-hydroxybenzoyl-CoA thioesterase
MAPVASGIFVAEIPVRFAHCDPAGIVFYPRYFEMFNSVVEDWCAEGLGVGFRELHLGQGLGLPTAHIETDFSAPSQLGDVLRAELSVQKLGGASITLSIRLLGPEGGQRVKSELVLVMMDLQRQRAVPIPDTLRERMRAFCTTDQKNEKGK